MRQAVRGLEALNDEGIHTLIQQPDLRVFWRKCFKGLPEVKWNLFWAVFPQRLSLPDISVPPAMVERLQRMLARAEDRLRFQQLLEKEDPATVSVGELRQLPAEEDLALVVEGLMGVPGSSTSQGGVDAARATAAASSNTPPGSTRFRLPPVDVHYCGREEDAQKVMGLMTRRLRRQGSQSRPTTAAGAPGMVVILAQGGMGKSCLALDVGWQLREEGVLGCGAVLVDLREARSAGEVEARFCAALDLDMVRWGRACWLSGVSHIRQ